MLKISPSNPQYALSIAATGPFTLLCRFFLERTGPTHELGNRTMLPFLIDMASLFELFVAEWLQAHLPSGVNLKVQSSVPIDHATGLHYKIDLLLSDASTGSTLCVLDTKYKAPDEPAYPDINQAVAYATIKDCRHALLAYPSDLPNPLDAVIGDIRVRSLTFSLAGDLEQAGNIFLNELLEVAPSVYAQHLVPNYPIG